MYAEYWDLKRAPFDNSIAPEMFYRSATHHAALLKLRYVIEHGLGAALLAGGIGCGKTYLVEMLSHELSEPYRPLVHVVFPQMSPAELLCYLAVELGMEESLADRSEGALDVVVRQIERHLAFHAEQGRRPVIVLDDAHLVENPKVFQALQLLMNLQHRKGAQFSILFVGEPSLLPKVRRNAQLDARIAVTGLLQPLSEPETAEYVEHRLRAAGAERPLFDDGALSALFALSGGVPRRINRLGDLALLVGYADGLETMTAAEVEAVAEELVGVVPD